MTTLPRRRNWIFDCAEDIAERFNKPDASVTVEDVIREHYRAYSPDAEELSAWLEDCILAMTECDCHPEVSGRADNVLTLYRERQRTTP